MGASANRRRVVGRTLRRSRRLSTRVPAAAGAGKPTGPLQAIEENTVVSLVEPASALRSATLRHFADSPVKKPRARVSGAEAPADAEAYGGGATKKRRRESQANARASTSAASAESARREDLLAMLDDLEAQVQERCEDIVVEAERKAGELQMELKVQMLFLPEAVRQMPWKTFVEDYGGSLANVIQTLSSSASITSSSQSSNSNSASKPVASRTRRQSRASTSRSSIQPSVATASKHSGAARGARSRGSIASSSTFSVVAETPGYDSRRLSAFQTPMFTVRKAHEPSSVLRTARKGELTYSARGSPILPETVVKAPSGSLVATFEDNSAPSACLKLDGDYALDLSDPGQLTDETRAHARSKLEALQAKVNELLKKLH